MQVCCGEIESSHVHRPGARWADTSATNSAVELGVIYLARENIRALRKNESLSRDLMPKAVIKGN